MIKVGLDIGNSKISCIICDIKLNAEPKVLSFVNRPTANIKKSTFTNFQLIKKEVKEVLDIAAKESQTDIKSINLNVPMSESNSLYYSSQIEIENELISDLHLKKSINSTS